MGSGASEQSSRAQNVGSYTNRSLSDMGIERKLVGEMGISCNVQAKVK